MAGDSRYSRRNSSWEFESTTIKNNFAVVLDSWAELPTNVIKKSFTSCALNVPVDGSEDDAIHCFKEEQPRSTGLAVLKSQLDILDEPETNPFDTEEYTSSDVEEACPIIQQLVSDHEGDSDIEID